MENSEQAPAAPTKRGRGRPQNSMNALSKQARELAASSGRLPHEILLAIARGIPIELKEVQPDGTLKSKYEPVGADQVLDAAKAAAPYYAPKISTVEVISGVSDHDLDAIIARAAAEAGVSLGAGGEGQEEPAAQGQQAARPAPRRERVQLRG